MPDLTTVLDSQTAIAKLDQSNMLGSIEALHQQVEQAWQETQDIEFHQSTAIKQVVICGMGGSALGADVIKHLYKDQLPVPIDIIRNYTLPKYVSKETLIILSSYSGTTEEVVACGQAATATEAQVMVIASGGTLIDMAKAHDWPYYQINPTHNPSGQPRMALGYAVFGMIALLSKAGLITLTQAEVDQVAAIIKTTVEQSAVSIKQDKNPAKILAYSIFDKRPIYVIADFLEGAGHVIANQTNENAKAFADYKVIPELNHHLMEGLRFPKSNSSTHIFVFFNSALYQDRNQKRMALTQKIVDENHIETMTVDLEATEPLAQAFELVALVGFASFYLSILEGIDPSPIPFVDKFKEELK